MRTPETHYITNGSIVFRKLHGKVRYNLKQWDEEGIRQESIKSGYVRDDQQVKELEKTRRIDTALQVLGSVS